MNYPSLNLETKLWQSGIKYIAGVDESGRGCLAGPVVAAAVIFKPNHHPINGVNDCKLLNPQQRLNLVSKIKHTALQWSVAEVDVNFIDQQNIIKASLEAMHQAIKKLTNIQYILVDGIHSPSINDFNNNNLEVIKRGDQQVYSIAAASIVAKVHRDNLMKTLHCQFPHYDWNNNKGYGTKTHRQALLSHGPCHYHRKMFLRKILGNQNRLG